MGAAAAVRATPRTPTHRRALADADIKDVDVLTNPVMRTAMKEYSSWPTFPQLYIGGEFVGGCDIVTQLHQSGELRTLLESSGAGGGAPAATKA